jgi:hypothetical protein
VRALLTPKQSNQAIELRAPARSSFPVTGPTSLASNIRSEPRLALELCGRERDRLSLARGKCGEDAAKDFSSVGVTVQLNQIPFK